MPDGIRSARLADLEVVALWLRSQADCALWAGPRVPFPVDRSALADQIEWGRSAPWSLADGGELAAFGQLIPKSNGRLHLARVIVAPDRRGQGLGRALVLHLLETARTRGASAISLNVESENGPAMRLYRSLGFTETARPTDEPASASIYMERAANAPG